MLRQGGPELSRRWLSALLLAPPSERQGIVEAIEERMTRLYSPQGRSNATQRERGDEGREVRVMMPPEEKGGYVEQVIRTYEVPPASQKKIRKTEKKKA